MDRERFIREVEDASGMMYRVAYSILRNDQDCQDAMQETALKAWENRNQLRDEDRFRTWMTRILINVCYAIARKRKRFVPLESVPERVSKAPDPTLAVALEALPEKLRVPLVLNCAEGMTYREIAEVLKLPMATVRGRIARAKETMRKELGEDEV